MRFNFARGVLSFFPGLWALNRKKFPLWPFSPFARQPAPWAISISSVNRGLLTVDFNPLMVAHRSMTL